MASPTKEIQKAAYSIADLGKNNTGTEKSKTSGRLFFLDAGGGRVFSANPDGSDLKVIISEGRKFPDGLVVDTTAGHIYWTNMGNPVADDGSIERADFGGTNTTNITRPGGTFTPKQLQLDDKNRKLYWCDREGMRVMRANLEIGLALDLKGGRMFITDLAGSVYSANLDGSNKKTLLAGEGKIKLRAQQSKALDVEAHA